jgi:ketosteroid isomerase-like protein
MADNVELVRRLWTAFERGGLDAVLEITDPDVEWEPYGGGGTVYRGHEGLRAYMGERRGRGEEIEGRLYSAFAKGDAVVARGEVRIKGEHGIVTMQPGWLYEFREGKLVRFRGFPTQEAALRAAGLAKTDPASTVRDLWDAFNRRQLEQMLELIADDCEWRTYAGRRDVYVGPEGVREYYEENFGRALSATATEYAFREIGDAIAVSGSLNIVDSAGGISQRQVHWLFVVRAGKVVRAESFRRRNEAAAAAEDTLSESPG